jgi:hypothetical protein
MSWPLLNRQCSPAPGLPEIWSWRSND